MAIEDPASVLAVLLEQVDALLAANGEDAPVTLGMLRDVLQLAVVRSVP